MKKVLVLVDFSDAQGRLIAAAEEEAKIREASLVLLHVIEPAAEVAGFETDPEMMRLRIGQDLEAEQRIEGERLKELAKQVESRGAKCESAVRFGLPADEILSAAAEHGADLLVKLAQGGLVGVLVFVDRTSGHRPLTVAPVHPVSSPREQKSIRGALAVA